MFKFLLYFCSENPPISGPSSKATLIMSKYRLSLKFKLISSASILNQMLLLAIAFIPIIPFVFVKELSFPRNDAASCLKMFFLGYSTHLA